MRFLEPLVAALVVVTVVALPGVAPFKQLNLDIATA